MRVTEFVLTVPRFFFAVVVIALFGAGMDRLILVLGVTSWPAIARSTIAASSTVQVKGPAWSRLNDSGMIPARLTRP